MEKFLKLIIIISLVIDLIANTLCNPTATQPPEDYLQWHFSTKPLFPYGPEAGDIPMSHLKKLLYANYYYNASDSINVPGGETRDISVVDFVPLIRLLMLGGPGIMSQDRCARIVPFTHLFCRGACLIDASCDIGVQILPRIPDNLYDWEYKAMRVRPYDKREKVESFMRKTRDREVPREIAEDIVKTYPDLVSGIISLQWALIFTWKDVQFYQSQALQSNSTKVLVSPRFSYQVALTSTSTSGGGGDMTFLVVNHEKFDWKFEEIKVHKEIQRSNANLKKLLGKCKDSHLNETGVSDRFVYRLDNAFVLKEIEAGNPYPLGRNYSQAANVTERIRIFPHVINILDTSDIELRMEMDGACFKEIDLSNSRVSCYLQDSAGNTEILKFFERHESSNRNLVIPYCAKNLERHLFRSLGRHTVKLELVYLDTGAVHTFYGHVYIVGNPPGLFRVTLDETEHELSIYWARNAFGPLNNTLLVAGLHGLDVTDMGLGGGGDEGERWIFLPFNNTGRYKIGVHPNVTKKLLKKGNQLVVACLTHSPGRATLNNPYSAVQAMLKHKLNVPKLYTHVRRIARKPDVGCLNFINSSSEKLGFPNDTEICPPTIEFAWRDPRFESLGGHLNNSFRQSVPAPSGAASVCSYYKTNGLLVLGYPSGATSLRFHPAYDYWKHKLQDEIPKQICCSDFDSCEAYYKKIPSKESTGYVIPRAARAVGAGHITTFDDAKQTLTGIGEFLLMTYKSPKLDGISLKVQVRMEQFLSSRGIKRKASVFTAFAMEESRAAVGETIRIQVEDKGVGSGIHVMLDGEPMQVDFNQVHGIEKKFKLSWKSVLLSKTIEGDEVEVTFASGFTFRFTSTSPKEMGLNLIVMGSCLRDNLRFSHEDIEMSGLLGDCDHNPENDFTVIASELEKTLELPWKIFSSEDSIFTYDGDGKSFDSYNNVAPYKSDFNLSDAIHSDHDGYLRLICGNQEDCIYDLQTTDSSSLAKAMRSSNDEFEKLRLFYRYATGICFNGENETSQRGRTKNAYDLVKYLPEGKRLQETCFPGYEMKKESGVSELSCDCNDNGAWKCTGGDGGVSCIQVEMEQEKNKTEIL